MRPGPPLALTDDRPADPGEALAWDAYCYLTDALTPGGVAAFERRLDRDQAAREALAAAVDLVGAATLLADRPAARPVGPRRLPRMGRPRGRRFAAAVAAALILVVVGPGRVGRWFAATRGEASRVAAAWSDLHRGATGDLAAEAGAEPEDGPADAADAEVLDVPAERPLPSWIVAAVAVLPGDEDAAGVMDENMGEGDDAESMQEGN